MSEQINQKDNYLLSIKRHFKDTNSLKVKNMEKDKTWNGNHERAGMVI